MTLTGEEALAAAAIGLVAGTVGGLSGIGGSIIMLPGLALLIGYDDAAHTKHHVYQAAALVVNFLVSVPAALRHRRANAVRWDLVRVLMPSLCVAVLTGVLISNRLNGDVLKQMLAAFIVIYCTINLARAVARRPEQPKDAERATVPVLIGVGGVGGLIGGVLGLGGGIIMVPGLQLVARVGLRHAIAASATVMCVSSIIAAGSKLLTLHQQGRSPADALAIAAAMGPTAMVGSWLGAHLTHAMPITAVRVFVSLCLLAVAAKLAGFF